MKCFYFTVALSTTLQIGYKKEEVQIKESCLHKLESTVQTNYYFN